MIALSVNINKIALIRNSRPGNYPNIVQWAKRCINYGAQGITIHPRPDQRHIRAQDAMVLKKALPHTELNIEGNPFESFQASQDEAISDYPGFMEIVKAVKPHQCTLVPDNNSQKTSDHGFDLTQKLGLENIINELQSMNIRVSLFMDPDISQITLAHKIGADRIELYTGPFAANPSQKTFDHYKKAAEHALNLGLEINAGHDLNLQNMVLFKQLPGLLEVSIGHALTVEALDLGLEKTIQSYIKLLG